MAEMATVQPAAGQARPLLPSSWFSSVRTARGLAACPLRASAFGPRRRTLAGRSRCRKWWCPVRVGCNRNTSSRHLKAARMQSASCACEEGNCHHHEGNKRCRRRIEAVSAMLGEIGLGKERLMLFHLPGSAVQDMAWVLGASVPATADPAAWSRRWRRCAMSSSRRVAALAPSPLRTTGLSEDVPYQLEDEDDSD